MRFYGGRIRQSHEKVNLADLIEGVLQERKTELGQLGIALRRKLKPLEVLIDPTVAHTFVNAVLDWALPFGNRIDVRLDLNSWPQNARLQVRVANDGLPPSSSAHMDNLSWMLIRQIANSAGGSNPPGTSTTTVSVSRPCSPAPFRRSMASRQSICPTITPARPCSSRCRAPTC